MTETWSNDIYNNWKPELLFERRRMTARSISTGISIKVPAKRTYSDSVYVCEICPKCAHAYTHRMYTHIDKWFSCIRHHMRTRHAAGLGKREKLRYSVCDNVRKPNGRLRGLCSEYYGVLSLYLVNIANGDFHDAHEWCLHASWPIISVKFATAYRERTISQTNSLINSLFVLANLSLLLRMNFDQCI